MVGPLHLPAHAVCLSITKVSGVTVLPGLLAGSHTGQWAGLDSAPMPGVEGWADQAPAREPLHLRTRIWVACDLLISLVRLHHCPSSAEERRLVGLLPGLCR